MIAVSKVIRQPLIGDRFLMIDYLGNKQMTNSIVHLIKEEINSYTFKNGKSRVEISKERFPYFTCKREFSNKRFTFVFIPLN